MYNMSFPYLSLENSVLPFYWTLESCLSLNGLCCSCLSSMIIFSKGLNIPFSWLPSLSSTFVHVLNGWVSGHFHSDSHFGIILPLWCSNYFNFHHLFCSYGRTQVARGRTVAFFGWNPFFSFIQITVVRLWDILLRHHGQDPHLV